MEREEWIRKIREEMERRGMKDSTLAFITGIDQGAISRWFTGQRKPSARSRETVERALGISSAPARESPDVQLQNALFTHPDLTREQADHFWHNIRLTLQDNRSKRQGLGRATG